MPRFVACTTLSICLSSEAFDLYKVWRASSSILGCCKLLYPFMSGPGGGLIVNAGQHAGQESKTCLSQSINLRLVTDELTLLFNSQ